MDATFSVLLCTVSALMEVYAAVPPEVCYHQFKWEDCGSPPKPVVYYYKAGSRCEVGIWRGCIPNPNMFADEYECVQACVFSPRVHAQDYHRQQEENLIASVEETTTSITTDNYIDETTGTANSDVEDNGITTTESNGSDTQTTNTETSTGPTSQTTVSDE